MALILHRSDRPLALADEFAELLARDPLDVFTSEVIVVGARGVERWLTQRLAHTLGAQTGDDGVAAGLDLRSPASLTALLLGRDRDDPWHADRLVWPLLDALDACLSEPGFEHVAQHLGAGPEPESARERWDQGARRSRRYAVARRVAGLFASYATERPGVLRAWEEGKSEDGCGAQLPADLSWQPLLWRATLAQMRARGLADESPVARQARVIEELRAGVGTLPDLPGRLSMFGHTRLTEADLDLLDALATRIDVHLWLPHPSPALWTALSGRTGTVARTADDSATAAAHPMLATLGRDVRELERALLQRSPEDHGPVPAERPRTQLTRLGVLQDDVRHNRAPSVSPPLPDDDRSIQVHACHGPARQVEVLREILVGLFDETSGSLQPRDVLVMCPDIETFAPLIHAAFGSSAHPDGEDGRHPGQRIRVQLADRALAAHNPFVDVAERLLQLVAGRVTSVEVLDLLGLPAVQRRFGLDEDSLDRVARWVTESGIRWGIDAAHRGEYGLGGLGVNTWEAGLDRLALGAAVSHDSTSPARHLLPLDDVGSQDIHSVAAVLEVMDLLESAARRVRSGDGETPGTMTARGWVAWLRAAVLGLADVSDTERWQVAQFERELALIGEAAGPQTRLRLTDVRVMVQQRWAARPTRSNFRTGAVTVCTMVPMRAVPHKVVIALGLDDGVYPRAAIVDGDDVLARRPSTGERDPRAEDGQLLLDAVMSASERFIAVYSGFDERTGARRPAAVPLQELLTAARRTGSGDDILDEATAPFLFTHPLQSFDERNFDGSGFFTQGTYDRHARDGAQVLRSARADNATVRGPLIPRPLPEQVESTVALEDLVSFYEHPAREFLRRRLEITVPRTQDEPETQIPLTVDGLDDWRIGDRLLREVRAGTPLAEAVDAERRRGALPPGALADPVISKVAGRVESILAAISAQPPEPLDVLLDLPGGVRLRGVVTDVVGDELETVTYSTVAPKHLIAAWIRLLAVTAAHPDRPWRARLLGKRRPVVLTSPGPERASQLLAELCAYRQKGMRFPLGLPPKTASAYAARFEQQLRRHPTERDAARLAGLDAAERTWATGRFPERDGDLWWARLYGTDSHASDLDAWNSLTYWAPLVWAPIHAAGGRM